MMKFIKLFFIPLMLVIFLLSACGADRTTPDTNSPDAASGEIGSAQPAETAEPASVPGTRTVTDANGQEVTIPYEVTRIAASGALNQIVLMLGGADKLVATAQGVQSGLFATVYPRIKSIPAAYAGAGPGVLNMETLLQARPEVVFGSFNEEDAQTLSSANIAMLGLSLNDPEDIKNTITLVGRVLGTEAEEKAAGFIEYYDGNLSYASERTKDGPKTRVFVASGDGSKGPINTIPANDINTAYLAAAGAVNIAAGKFPAAPAGGAAAVDFEFLIGEQPEVIIATSKSVYDYITDAGNGSQWQALTAVKNKKVYLNPKGVYLWSVRSAEGALQPLWLAKTLHPELFEDLDIAARVKEFYKTYYYYDVQEAEVEDILNPKS
jgi:iron complex transport system substrate-binding protein